jgi:hypothetical protein
MSKTFRISSLRILSVFAVAAMLSAAFAHAQSTSSLTESSSNPSYLLADGGPDGASGAPAASAGGGDEGSSHRGFGRHGIPGTFTGEVGGGFNAPIGNDLPYITWGGNVTAGAGLRFSKQFSLLGEFQFLGNKLPGAFIAAGGGQGGNAHIISFTAAPVIDLFPKRTNSIYLTGGGGYYHKSTNFTIQECCDFYGYPVSVTANSFTSNQLGGSFGFGLSHKMGGLYGDGKSQVFAEARYLYIHTPAITETNGLGATELIPVTVGLRF